jgi:hypothetical protein
MTARITDKERAEIRRHVSDREKLAMAMAAERSAELLAEFEKHISATYEWSDSEVWAEAHAKAQVAVAEAKIVIARECTLLGIPSTFQPSVHMYWSSRDEDAVNQRRTELRRVAKAEIERIEQQAKVAIEHAHLKARVKLTEIGLHSPEARKFVAALPAVESLMPPLTFERIEQLMLKRVRNQSGYTRPQIGAVVDDAAADDDTPAA